MVTEELLNSPQLQNGMLLQGWQQWENTYNQHGICPRGSISTNAQAFAKLP